jgi:hypothetical protein
MQRTNLAVGTRIVVSGFLQFIIQKKSEYFFNQINGNRYPDQYYDDILQHERDFLGIFRP